ncbi:MAG: MobA/MobL family protein, partial [Oscillospiraceae bacterium]|nr:MobA/MobL family protein [Oscillospiraceae bacterium]
YADRQTLWNAVEEAEKLPQAQLAYSLDIALQSELTEEENRGLARRFCRENFLSRGMIVDLAIHDPDKDGGIRNPHFHVLCPIRPLDESGAWGAKQRRVYKPDEGGSRIRDETGQYVFSAVPTTDWGRPETLDEWRRAWAEMVNAKFAEKGLLCRIDSRTLAEQGEERPPTVHEGPAVRAMENRGVPTEVGSYNRMIRTSNSLYARIKKALAAITAILAELKDDRTTLNEPALFLYLGEYYSVRNKYAEQNFGHGANKAKAGNLKKYVEEVALLRQRELYTVENLKNYASSVSGRNSELAEKQRRNKAKIRELSELVRHAENYKRYKPLVSEMDSIRWKGKREAFRAAHDSELMQFYMAQRILKKKAPDGKNRTAEWKAEISKLMEENEAMNGQQSKTYQEIKTIFKIVSHVEEGRRAYEGGRDISRQNQQER